MQTEFAPHQRIAGLIQLVVLPNLSRTHNGIAGNSVMGSYPPLIRRKPPVAFPAPPPRAPAHLPKAPQPIIAEFFIIDAPDFNEADKMRSHVIRCRLRSSIGPEMRLQQPEDLVARDHLVGAGAFFDRVLVVAAKAGIHTISLFRSANYSYHLLNHRLRTFAWWQNRVS
jgi:hypothetical protein